MNFSDSQQHLTKEEMVIQGSYYTSEKIVNKVLELLKKNISNYSDYVLIDTSCGYGSFLHSTDFKSVIGNDIDEEVVQKCPDHVMKTFGNALYNVTDKRSEWGVEDDKIIIVGNPPYNDITS
jgi:2-polyprenyl-3-methyl-5-hydroxy-6-metoxy-1,4-benzoquinol methylase